MSAAKQGEGMTFKCVVATIAVYIAGMALMVYLTTQAGEYERAHGTPVALRCGGQP